jgi:hypothetical protein
VRLGRLERPACCFGGNRSIHLSYSRIAVSTRKQMSTKTPFNCSQNLQCRCGVCELIFNSFVLCIKQPLQGCARFRKQPVEELNLRLWFRRPALYPTELQARISSLSFPC